jgi:aminopeptidase N
MEKIILEDVVVKSSNQAKTVQYQPMEQRVTDLLHTTLYLEFDYQRQWVRGEAVLRLKPYAQSLRSIDLDARNFYLLKVGAIKGKDTLNLAFSYDSFYLHITPPAGLLKATDTLQVYVQYIAKPEEIKALGGRAITDSRGLYFINPLGSDPNKPRQIWTQGETEYNSCWFPTIDAPNEKHTQDIFLTIDSGEVSLSNGLLVSSVKLKNGKHLDHWQQLKPHAPYLTMLAIGNFTITKDTWRNKEVSYYVEPAFAPYARTIFGNTPKMLEAFSVITGVEYPWDKFSQVICRDFVSGAMENTSAVVHYEGVQHTPREHLDDTHEDIIVHELFHQWFGDYVTCKSWSHLPLNESFATYGEYLYNEYTYGKEYADWSFSKNLEAYFRNKAKFRVSPVRRHYAEADDVFDVISYQKGSWILHQLRHEVGDAAFFKGINRYLTQNAYATADIDNLRMAMEWASGKDLHLFFQQWFEGVGHPELTLNTYIDNKISTQKRWLEINQIQDSMFGVFSFKSTIHTLWSKDGKNFVLDSFEVQVSHAYELIAFRVPQNFTAEDLQSWWMDDKGCLPAIIREKKPMTAWSLQLHHAGNYQARKRAAKEIIELPIEVGSGIQKDMISFGLNHKQKYYQLLALDALEKLDTFYTPELEQQLMNLASNSVHASVRDEITYLVGYKGNYEQVKPFLLRMLNDSSYEVMSSALQGIAQHEVPLALEKCGSLESVASPVLQRTIAWMYANHSTANMNDYFKSVLGKYGLQRTSILNAYGTYLRKQNAATLNQGLIILQNYYLLSSDRNKAKLMKGLLKTMQAKSAETAVFEGAFFKDFLVRVNRDLENN